MRRASGIWITPACFGCMSDDMKNAPPVVLIGPRATDDSIAIWRVCVAHGWPVHRLQGWRVPEDLLTSQAEIVIYGEPLLAKVVVDQMGLILMEPDIDWLTTLPFQYVSREIKLMTLHEARQLESSAFVKPADGKIFDPRVYTTGGELPAEAAVDQDIPVLRSGIMDFRIEIRCFIKDRQIVTMSPYWREGELAQSADGEWPFIGSEESEACHFAQQVLGDPNVRFVPGCTLDVGKTNDGIWAVIESNPSWGAGLYGCDPLLVMHSIRAAIKRKTRA